jgi:hypothetical protein
VRRAAQTAALRRQLYLGAINQRLEAARFECRFDPIREGCANRR